MKKIVSLVLVLIMTMMLFVGCVDGAATQPTKEPVEAQLDFSALFKAMNNSYINNTPGNCRYEHIDTHNAEQYIARIQYLGGNGKLKYWDFSNDDGNDYSKKVEADITDDEWNYVKWEWTKGKSGYKPEWSWYVDYLYFENKAGDYLSEDIKAGKVIMDKVEGNVYGYYYVAQQFYLTLKIEDNRVVEKIVYDIVEGQEKTFERHFKYHMIDEIVLPDELFVKK